MHKLFKPLSKRDAKIAAVLFGLGFLYMLYTIVKEVMAGRTFDELHSDLIILAFIAIIEWGMITVGFSKDKKEDEEEEEPETVLEGENEREGSEEFTEGLSEEFGGYSGSEGGDPGDDGDGGDGSGGAE